MRLSVITQSETNTINAYNVDWIDPVDKQHFIKDIEESLSQGLKVIIRQNTEPVSANEQCMGCRIIHGPKTTCNTNCPNTPSSFCL